IHIPAVDALDGGTGAQFDGEADHVGERSGRRQEINDVALISVSIFRSSRVREEERRSGWRSAGPKEKGRGPFGAAPSSIRHDPDDQPRAAISSGTAVL